MLRLLTKTNYFTHSLSKLPIIDLLPYRNGSNDRKHVASEIRKALSNTGFLYVKNHGIQQQVQAKMMKEVKHFFELPINEKMKIHMETSGKLARGYFNVDEEVTNGARDKKEGILIGRQFEDNHPMVLKGMPLHGRNLFHPSLHEFKQITLKWLQQMASLGEIIMQGIAQSLGLDRYYFEQQYAKQHYSSGILLHYPPKQNVLEGWGVGEHTDYGYVALLHVSDKGLQVLNRNDEWIEVDPIEGTIIVNIGDMLERMTKGLFRSTLHRVRNLQGRHRYSLPYFYDPPFDSLVGELNFEVSEEEKLLMEKTRLSKRWDEVLSFKGTYGDYFFKRYIKAYPEWVKYIST